MFDSVSLMFSDIPQFERIAASCSAMQVVNFLNSVYSAFDDHVHRHNVYKLETIRDSYVVRHSGNRSDTKGCV